MDSLHTVAGNQWRKGIHRPGGTLSSRVSSIQEEQLFWKKRIASGMVQPDAYSTLIWEKICEMTAACSISSVLEIGLGWGNYTFRFCRHFRQVACVDISHDNLRFLEEKSCQEGFTLTTYCSAWETATVGRWDLVFGYNCLYRVLEPELFLRKMNDAARKLCVIGMNCPPEYPWLPALEEAGIPVHYTRQGCVELEKVLSSLGIQGEFIRIPNRRTYRYESRDKVLSRAKQFLLKPCEEEALWEVLAPFHNQMESEWICEYPFHSHLLAWKPV